MKCLEKRCPWQKDSNEMVLLEDSQSMNHLEKSRVWTQTGMLTLTSPTMQFAYLIFFLVLNSRCVKGSIQFSRQTLSLRDQVLHV